MRRRQHPSYVEVSVEPGFERIARAADAAAEAVLTEDALLRATGILPDTAPTDRSL